MRILIADDHHLVRRGVGDLLTKEAGWEICGEATDAAQAFQKAGELSPDLILLDISMPDGSGLDAARRIRQEIPHVKILMMSHHDATQFERSAIESGADGCIDKARLALDLVAMIKSLQPNSTSQASPKFR
ncbi:MAG: response regulator transcription factor [Candidatus Acidiferrales bacterium]